MTDSILRVENLSKRYLLRHHAQEPYTTLRDAIATGARSLGRRLMQPRTRSPRSTQEEFWALKDVSFEVKQGDRVGIIGRNGAGKSTLLKILSRITEPTTGSIKIKGRVASLLEVGTGFHPELTGRENIYLNGAILGMGRVEIKRKFDEIVDFAEIEKFLDTPVKRYSSGMYVRLAFAVAAHLEPEILIVDEVLAVGDAQFQKKCLGKMKDVGQEGRTVLFVSHNMSAILSLCEYCLVLQKGKVIINETAPEAIQLYLKDADISGSFSLSKRDTKKPQIVWGKLTCQENLSKPEVQIDIDIFADYKGLTSLDLRLTDRVGNPVGFGSLGVFKREHLIELEPGLNRVSFTFPSQQLAVGTYIISLDLSLPSIEFFDRVNNCLFFDVNRPGTDGSTQVLLQSWGYGALEIPITRKSLEDTLEIT